MGKARDERFVERVLTAGERQTLLCSGHPDALLWTFWAAKETAFKAASKLYPDISSAPRRYRVIWNCGKRGILSGTVKTPAGLVWIKIFPHEDYIHCIGATVWRSAFDRIVFGINEITPGEGADYPYDFPSTAVRTMAKKRIESYTGCDKDEIQILKNKTVRGQGPPIVWIKGKKADIDISLSHDGRFVAFAFIPA